LLVTGPNCPIAESIREFGFANPVLIDPEGGIIAVSGVRHGLVPMRKGQLGHLTAVHLRTSSLEPPQQSRQCAAILASLLM
jgi:hypothetical protein